MHDSHRWLLLMSMYRRQAANFKAVQPSLLAARYAPQHTCVCCEGERMSQLSSGTQQLNPFTEVVWQRGPRRWGGLRKGHPIRIERPAPWLLGIPLPPIPSVPTLALGAQIYCHYCHYFACVCRGCTTNSLELHCSPAVASHSSWWFHWWVRGCKPGVKQALCCNVLRGSQM